MEIPRVYLVFCFEHRITPANRVGRLVPKELSEEIETL